jgi:3',5'-cyclic AMP phosphodiesterase CpdA
MADGGPYRVAIIADAHFHDPAGNFGGLGIDLGGERLALRSWKDTETGPRAVNESAAALTAALDRIVAAGVKHVVLAGDYTDDGQSENTRRLAARLQHYRDRFGLRFYAIPGNHDLFGPHGKHVSTRFVTVPGQTMLVTSDPDQDHDAVVTPAMRCEGQPAALMPMAAFGLFRQADYLHWETPFGGSDARAARLFDATAADGSVTHRLMDASYLVEPERGLWLLLIDANVFEPQPGRSDPLRKKAFLDASDAGWSAVLRLKPFLLPWIASVTARAKAEGKTLITVSHYPVLDPFRDDYGSEQALFGPTAFVRRTPLPDVGRALIGAGLRWHAGGHLHINATTRMTTAAGTLTDLALPSLVAFPGAFKIVHADANAVEMETVTLDDLSPDPRLLSLYAAEGRKSPVQSFGPFLAEQFRARLRARRIPADWPAHLAKELSQMTAGDLVTRIGCPADIVVDEADFQAYPLLDLVTDAYLLREAGPLARRWIDPSRLQMCRVLARDFGDGSSDPKASDAAFFRRFLSTLQAALDRVDADGSVIGQVPGQ